MDMGLVPETRFLAWLSQVAPLNRVFVETNKTLVADHFRAYYRHRKIEQIGLKQWISLLNSTLTNDLSTHRLFQQFIRLGTEDKPGVGISQLQTFYESLIEEFGTVANISPLHDSKQWTFVQTPDSP
jgi:hypothetical protein